MSTHCFRSLPLYLAASLMKILKHTEWNRNRNLHEKTKRKLIFFVHENDSVRSVSFPFRLIVKSKPGHIKELKDIEGFLIHVSHVSYCLFPPESPVGHPEGWNAFSLSHHGPICQIELLQLWYLFAPFNKGGTVPSSIQPPFQS